MKTLLSGIVIGALGLFAYQRAFQTPSARAPAPVSEPEAAMRVVEQPAAPRFSCDGRTYCSQMTSCAEATYFLEHCPGVKMDGEGDGVPCEGQWCGQQ